MSQEEKQTQSTEQSEQEDQALLIKDVRRAAIGGVLAAAAILLGALVINLTTEGDARLLLESMLPSVRILCSGIMTATTTILALMLTMLSMSNTSEIRFKETYYKRVRQIALVDTAVFAGGVILLLTTSLPFEESLSVGANWYQISYAGILLAAAILGGGVLGVMLLLYGALIGVISVLHPDKSSELTRRQK